MLKSLYELIADLWYDESGHHLMEYALLLTLIAMAIMGAIQTTSAKLAVSFEALSNKFQ